ncbi:hypothetical protein BDZ90DRAFT_188867 [Jaminaea rosea]|uniref:HMG box domain-containing protein n=1 Tax=Jaminaea rosea TaxID=1569628 RepID=A0A316UTL1_9BASI|nr:hypothetical protein BDZ90DRAFT_188867 [Jaminaea rosea]PWN27243.1 hypothetical protein BDZ90DRAFT_188867 [Jaminaea rosea]
MPTTPARPKSEESSASTPRKKRSQAPGSVTSSPASPSSPPRPPNAWILYRSFKIEQLKQSEGAAATATSDQDHATTPTKTKKRRSQSPAKGALTATALAALAAASPSSFDSPFSKTPRSQPATATTPSLASGPTSSSFAPSSSHTSSSPNSRSKAGPAPSTFSTSTAATSSSTASSSTTPNVSTLIAQLWATEPPQVKESFHALAREKEEEHKRLWPDYKYKPSVTDKAKRARARRRRGRDGEPVSSRLEGSPLRGVGANGERRSGSPVRESVAPYPSTPVRERVKMLSNPTPGPFDKATAPATPGDPSPTSGYRTVSGSSSNATATTADTCIVHDTTPSSHSLRSGHDYIFGAPPPLGLHDALAPPVAAWQSPSPSLSPSPTLARTLGLTNHHHGEGEVATSQLGGETDIGANFDLDPELMDWLNAQTADAFAPLPSPPGMAAHAQVAAASQGEMVGMDVDSKWSRTDPLQLGGAGPCSSMNASNQAFTDLFTTPLPAPPPAPPPPQTAPFPASDSTAAAAAATGDDTLCHLSFSLDASRLEHLLADPVDRCVLPSEVKAREQRQQQQQESEGEGTATGTGTFAWNRLASSSILSSSEITAPRAAPSSPSPRPPWVNDTESAARPVSPHSRTSSNLSPMPMTRRDPPGAPIPSRETSRSRPCSPTPVSPHRFPRPRAARLRLPAQVSGPSSSPPPPSLCKTRATPTSLRPQAHRGEPSGSSIASSSSSSSSSLSLQSKSQRPARSFADHEGSSAATMAGVTESSPRRQGSRGRRTEFLLNGAYTAKELKRLLEASGEEEGEGEEDRTGSPNDEA